MSLRLGFDVSPLEGGATDDEKRQVITREDAERFAHTPPGNVRAKEMGPDVEMMDHEPLSHVPEIRHVMKDHGDEKDGDRKDGCSGRLDVETREHERQAHKRHGFKGHENVDDREPLPGGGPFECADDLVER